MAKTEFGIVTFVNLVHRKNALLPINVTVFGIVYDDTFIPSGNVIKIV
uniref:Uncharacterized protein n=1 Tax=viral metagenome TaxID=1070528 RepID=A0A6C0IJ47_9ZZZZ